MISSFALIGFGAGNAQLAACALPELLPNKWRHIAIVIAGFWVIVAAVVGPVASRFAGASNKAGWQWLFSGPAICTAMSFIGLYLCYFPPEHPQGNQAGNQRARLWRSHSFHRGHDSHSHRNQLQHRPTELESGRHWHTLVRFRTHGRLRVV